MRLLILAFVALWGVAVTAERKENIFDKQGYLYDHRKRLGHFEGAPFVELYEQYAAAFLYKDRPDLDVDHYSRFRPTATVCRSAFNAYFVNDKQLADFDAFVVLDACLGFLFEGTFKEETEGEERALFEDYAKDDKLNALWNTDIDNFSDRSRTCIADLLLRATLAKAKYDTSVCNNKMIQIYLQFAECERDSDNYLSVAQKDDSYVQELLGILLRRAQTCFEVELRTIERAVRERFSKQRNFLDVFVTGEQEVQRVNRMWPREVATLLAAIVGTRKDPISLRQVNQYLSSFGPRRDNKMKNMFLENIAKFADRKIDAHNSALPAPSSAKKSRLTRLANKFDSSKLEADLDPTGSERYRKLVNQLCNPFRSADNEDTFDYALSIIRLFELTKYEPLFQVSRDQFVNGVVKYTREVGPIYACASACNLLSFTSASFLNQPGVPKYKVTFRPNVSKMVLWPGADNI